MDKQTMIKNKQGAVVDILIFIVIGFVAVLFFAMWIYTQGIVVDTLESVESPDSNINISNITKQTFGEVQEAEEKWIPTLAYILMFGMALSILIGNFLVRAHPVFFIVYLMVTIGAIIGSVYLSNQYETFLSSGVLADTLQSFDGASFILLNLPIWVAVIGIIGAVMLFAGIMRDRELGGGIV